MSFSSPFPDVEIPDASVAVDHPAIADAAVVGVPDDSRQEIPKAFVVKPSGTELGSSRPVQHEFELM